MANLNISSTLNGIQNQAVEQIQNMNEAAAKIHTQEVSTLHALGDSAGAIVGTILTKNYIKHMRAATDTITTVRKKALQSLLNNRRFSWDPALKSEIQSLVNELDTAQRELASKPNRYKTERLRMKINSCNSKLTEAMKKLPTPTGRAAGASAIEAAKYCNDIFEGKHRMNLPKVLEGHPDVVRAASSLRRGLTRTQQTALKNVANQALKNPGFKAKFGRLFNQAGRFIGPAMIAYSVYDAAANIVQEEYDPTQQEHINKLSSLMNTDTGDRAYDDLPADKKRELIEWAIKNETDPKGLEILKAIQSKGYDVRAYLESINPKMKFDVENKEAPVTEAWVNGINENISNGISAQFYGKLLEQQQQLTGERGIPPQNSDEVLPEGEVITIPTTPEGPTKEPGQTQTPPADGPDKTTTEEAGAGAGAAGSGDDKDDKGQDKDKEEEQAGAEAGVLANGGKGGGNPPKGSKPGSTKSVTTTVPPTNVPGSVQQPGVIGQSPAGSDKSSQTTTNLPPEAIVQQPEEQSFWTWKNILMIGAAVATLGLGTFFILKYKKKADKEKKKTSALQSTVNDLQTQLNDLQSDTTPTTDPTTLTTNDGSLLANSGTNITNNTLDTVNQVLQTNDNSRV